MINFPSFEFSLSWNVDVRSDQKCLKFHFPVKVFHVE